MTVTEHPKAVADTPAANLPTTVVPLHAPGSGEITTLVVCDNLLLREGIQALLRKSPELDVFGEHSADFAPGPMLRLIQELRPQVVILAARGRVESTTALIRTIRSRPTAPQVIVLADSLPSRDACLAVMRSGAAGFLLSDLEAETLAGAVRSVIRGGAAISPKVARLLLELLNDIDVDRMRQARSALHDLSQRELDVLECLSRGMGNTQIGRALFMSEGSVKAYVSRLLVKLECTNRVQAAILWRDARLQTPPGTPSAQPPTHAPSAHTPPPAALPDRRPGRIVLPNH